ncbi:hypothetical protein PR202_ga09551 [Eleusine coracana subsp. coracana]|uniref:RRM domain-containing protein n=1 Tax=Eleusine coracana subsp. coracana TaxID=191504 RepID=A0AAV5C4I2_ELECO|nr:hypothetical protein PR202_ga09551 [Eleusine coracana subsp. coracana]
MENAGERRPSDGAEPSTTPIMTSAAEPPPKKRKLVDAQFPSPSSTPAPAPPAEQPPSTSPPPAVPPETLAAAAPSSSSPAPETTPLSAEEVIRKRRNREELCRVYECHRRIRSYIDSKDAALLPQLEQDYLLLISASRGSASAQRFLSLLIPRFSSYCPTALEAAAKVSINMYKLNIAIVTRGEDVKDFAYQTTRDCILGLTDICSAASSEAPKSSVLKGICSAVYRTVLAFFISTFDGENIYHIGSRKFPMLQDPVKLLESSKELKDTNMPTLDYLFELRALCLLCTFLLFPENVLEACFALLSSGETNDVKGGLYLLNQLTSCLNIDVANDSLGDNTDGQCLGMEKNMSGTENIVDSKPSSGDSVLLRNSMIESNECYMAMVSSCLKVLGSLSEPAEDKVDTDTESSVLERLDKNTRENMQSDELISSSEQGVLSKNGSTDTCVEKSSHVKDVDMVHTDDKISEKQTHAKNDGSKGVSVVSDAVHKSTRSDLLTAKSAYDSAGGSSTITSPGQHFGKAKHLCPEPFDIYGASTSRDVISVSKELWVGSLGNRAAEALVKSKFEEFGPLGNLLLFPSKGFALVEYRNILHAVCACGSMQGSSIWGGFLQIRYLDRLIGSRGFIGGVAIGESRHIYVAKIKNQKDKDEVFDQLKAAGLKRPCGITDIPSENALLLEFEMAVDAATAKVYIRRQAHADVCSKDNMPGHQLLVQNIDNSVPDMELINAFTRYGEIIRWQFNRPNGNCLIIYRSHDAAAYATSQLHGTRFGMKSITVESRTCTAGFLHDKAVSSVAPMLGQSAPDNSIHHDVRQAHLPSLQLFYGWNIGSIYCYFICPPPSNTKQVWQHKEMESNRTPQGIHPCPPVSTHRGSVMPPPPIQTSFVRPVFPGPGSPWENTTPNPPFSHVSPRMMPGSNFRVNPSGTFPFRPSSVAPLAQHPGSSAPHSETMPPPPPREVCQLLPCSNGDQKGLRDFISYLKQRECAGVIKIPPVKPMWSRLLFILPPTAEACGMLALPPHPADCLIALILPKETNAEAA